MNFEALKPSDIEVRIGNIYENAVSMLLYKNARVDMRMLDETVGEYNWQRDHKEIKGNLYCGIGIWDDKKSQWVWKWDCGTESYTEKEKGEASDSFKRAGFNWGIGRELYTAPRIYLTVATNEKKNGKGYELNNPRELNGIYVSEFETALQDGKRIITKLVLKQHAQRREWEVYRWERR